MKEYTHIIAGVIVDKMNEYKKYSESEKIVIKYGMEIFLNNILKLIIYLTIGIVCDLFLETLIAVFTLMVLISMSGGFHSQSDFNCLLLSGTMVFLPIKFAKYIDIKQEFFSVLLLGIVLMYFLYAPQDEKYKEASKIKLLRIKFNVILVMIVIWLIGLNIGKQLGVIAVLVSLLQGISLKIGGEHNV